MVRFVSLYSPGYNFVSSQRMFMRITRLVFRIPLLITPGCRYLQSDNPKPTGSEKRKEILSSSPPANNRRHRSMHRSDGCPDHRHRFRWAKVTNRSITRIRYTCFTCYPAHTRPMTSEGPKCHESWGRTSRSAH